MYPVNTQIEIIIIVLLWEPSKSRYIIKMKLLSLYHLLWGLLSLANKFAEIIIIEPFTMGTSW